MSDLIKELTSKSGLFSTPDGNKYIKEDRELIDYIREKCGYEVSDCVEEIFEQSSNFMTPEDKIVHAVDGIELCIDNLTSIKTYNHNNPVLRLKELNKLVPLLQDVLTLLEKFVY